MAQTPVPSRDVRVEKVIVRIEAEYLLLCLGHCGELSHRLVRALTFRHTSV